MPGTRSFVQPAEELLKGPVARRGRRWRGTLKLGRDERLDVVPMDAAHGGGHALAGEQRHEERSVVRVCPGSSAGTGWLPQGGDAGTAEVR